MDNQNIEIHKILTHALDDMNVVRFISDVKSGKHGYRCLQCGGELVAKKHKDRLDHFAHDPKDVSRLGKCTYSDETYRHKIAKEILQRIKQIKVPALYKLPPNRLV